MAPPHRCVALMAAVAAVALLSSLDAPVAWARVRNLWDGMEDHAVLMSPYSVKAVRFSINEAERVNTLKVLQAFAAAMPSLRWSGDDFCSWSGVRCKGCNVSIVVGDDAITGTLPEMPDDVDYSMVKLDHMVLFGRNGGLTGTLPSSWGKLHKMRALGLAYTGIRGTLPLSWRSMSSLGYLALSFTEVSGTLPASWASMAAIEQIILSTTQISGTLPEAWSGMRNLRRIYLDECNLHGSLPESWARIRYLERVSPHHNHFCGCVPQSWLRSHLLLMGVDAKHRMLNCSSVDACVPTVAPEPSGSASTLTTDEPTTASAPSDPQCSVSKCLWCLAGNSFRCRVCSQGYLLTGSLQCVEGPPMDAAVTPVRSAAAALISATAVVMWAVTLP